MLCKNDLHAVNVCILATQRQLKKCSSFYRFQLKLRNFHLWLHRFMHGFFNCFCSYSWQHHCFTIAYLVRYMVSGC